MSDAIRPVRIPVGYNGDVEYRRGWSLADVKLLHKHLADRHVRTRIADPECAECMRLVREGDAHANGH